jgi:steroid delta-isomerase-like uncharacterized protein
MSSPATFHSEFAAAWNRRDWQAIRNLLHPDYSYTAGDGKEMTGGPEAGVKVGQMYAQAFPDATLEVRHVYVQGNTAVAEMVGRGTHQGPLMGVAPTNRKVEITICNVVEMRDGKAYREREYMDMLHMLTQLGVTTAPGRAAGA